MSSHLRGNYLSAVIGAGCSGHLVGFRGGPPEHGDRRDDRPDDGRPEWDVDTEQPVTDVEDSAVDEAGRDEQDLESRDCGGAVSEPDGETPAPDHDNSDGHEYRHDAAECGDAGAQEDIVQRLGDLWKCPTRTPGDNEQELAEQHVEGERYEAPPKKARVATPSPPSALRRVP